MNIFLITFSVLLLTFTLLSVIKHQYWIFRVFDYPRLQKLGLSVICLALFVFFFKGSAVLLYIFLVLLLANIIYLSSQIIPFTPLGRKQVLRAHQDVPEQSICIMIANVFQYNTNFKGCLKEIGKYKPDVVLLLETDKRWDNETAALAKAYPYEVKVPLENTYGMLLYSKLKLEDAEVKYLVQDGIPSIHTVVVLESGTKIKLFAVHPTPPVPGENPRSTERDKELLLVADLAKASHLPVIVIGDLNDVAWSYTTELFLKMSGLIDPRRGRGFYNSFHAHYPVIRFPLDHAFISTDFKLKGIKRLSNFDSDHFPIYIHLQYEKKASAEQESMEPDDEDIAIAAEKKEAV
ncbi:endonuclease/exonuclease/phosphatase family protein [Mucilaginibacter psychrotolerans]|uniref:Endonuclease/exonuclease/phosphatase family protein n=1 Tax=Mucilaginibacter psychrotolerans TaxID=1524096 RepID=A0A4Y8SCG1_9SPHI|nr:endonuclease/exonuclease/phosphatase family protein [Mucilaginibacter psychrotolerans]TFF36287.1 endonuclease/exonuclease/phosphatase family protein [Mucilaginibacter psychrotolerans]